MAGLLYRDLVLNKKNLLSIALGEIGISILMFFPLIFEDGYAECAFSNCSSTE